MFKNGNRHRHQIKSDEQVAVEKQEGQIAEAVNSLVAVGILLTTLGVGALMGWMG